MHNVSAHDAVIIPFTMLATPPDFTLIQDADSAFASGTEMRLWFRGAELLVDESGARPMQSARLE